jgi:translocation and assembly module TamB
MSASTVARKTLLILVAALGGVLLSAVAFVAWMFNTQAGTRWALSTAGSVTNDALQVKSTSGTLAGPLQLDEVRYRDAAGALDVAVQRVQLDLDASQLLSMTVHVLNLDVRGVSMKVGPPQAPPPEEPATPFSLDPPIDVVLERVRVTNVAVTRDAATLVAVDVAELAGAWTEAGGLVLKQLDVRSPQGQVHFAGNVRGHERYEGTGEGRIRWTQGERTYAATLQTQAQAGRLVADVHVSEPLRTQAHLEAEQSKPFPWTLTLEVPEFDPREGLLPDSSLTQLAAKLRGSGDADNAVLSGTLSVNEEPLNIERMSVAREGDDVRIDARLLPAQGHVDIDGLLQLAQAPMKAKVNLEWGEVVIPESLAGQILHTQGDLDFDGSAENYSAIGTIKLGPPERIADIGLDVAGTAQRVEIRQFDIRQPKGSLRAVGAVELQPVLAWQANAQATHFNPGEFAVAWKGDLNFALETSGRMLESGPTADLLLKTLNGHLRGRPVEGTGDLHLSEQRVLAGHLRLRSGGSRIRVEGQQGETMNATATFDIASLNDWVPDSGGTLQGQINATGRWPDLEVKLRSRGNGLRLATARADSLELAANVNRLNDPRGDLSLQGTQVSAAGLLFETFDVKAQGEMKAHALQLTANGQPLSTRLRLHGARTGDETHPGWSGSFDELVLDVQKIPRMALQKPVQIQFVDRSLRMSEACLAGDDIHLCASAQTEKTGALQARYSLRNLPLALASSLSGSSAPFDLSGTIEGNGEIQRDAEGRMRGQILVTSTRGAISRRAEPPLTDSQTLLSYADLRLDAKLDGTNGTGSLDARLNDSGSLDGDVQLAGLGEIATQVRGKVRAYLPSISVIEAFAPQLANVQGKLHIDLGVAGTLDEPKLDGTVRADELATDIPTVGLKLRRGEFNVSPRSANEFALNGQVASGDGMLRFDGTATTQGAVRMNVNGQRFIAADIPGARVEIDPDLNFTRSAERMTLEGDLRIPTARIDMQKLPRTQSTQKASPDVVVVDAKTQEQAHAEKIPLYATIRVALGEKVELVGFGLDAKVGGELVVREIPGSPTTGSGEVRVTGTYKAYGQDLTIRQGQLLFAGTPLENPNLSIIAVREVDTVIAGLRVQGSARNPQLSVFSEPPMAQSNALAYLVTGKPLNEVGSGEGDAVQTAARSLGTAAGGLLAKNLGKRLGVDEVGVKDSEAIGGAALTVGQYLSPRLYLSYGVGLFEPGEVVTLRYKLSKQFTIEALNGPRDSRAGVEYRIEK